MKVWNTLRYLIRNPLVLLLHFTIWALFLFLFGWILSNNIIGTLQTLMERIPAILLLCFITSYRFSRGKLNGISNTQQQWMNWSDYPEKEIPDDPNHFPQTLPQLSKIKYILNTLKNIVLISLRNPMLYVFHFLCWHYISFLGSLLDEPFRYSIVEDQITGIYQIFSRTVSDMSHDYIFGILFIALLAFSTFIPEVIGKLNGSHQEHQHWQKWYKSNNDPLQAQNISIGTTTAINKETGILFLKTVSITTFIYAIIIMILLFIIAVQLIPISESSGIQYISWIALFLLFLE